MIASPNASNEASKHPPDRQGNKWLAPKLFEEKWEKLSSPHLGEILLSIVLVARVDLFEYSNCPPERNIKWPKTDYKMAKNGWKLSKVAIIGSTRSLLAKNGRKWVLANQIWPTSLSAAIVFRYTRFQPKKHWELPFLAIAPKYPISIINFGILSRLMIALFVGC